LLKGALKSNYTVRGRLDLDDIKYPNIESWTNA